MNHRLHPIQGYHCPSNTVKLAHPSSASGRPLNLAFKLLRSSQLRRTMSELPESNLKSMPSFQRVCVSGFLVLWLAWRLHYSLRSFIQCPVSVKSEDYPTTPLRVLILERQSNVTLGHYPSILGTPIVRLLYLIATLDTLLPHYVSSPIKGKYPVLMACSVPASLT